MTSAKLTKRISLRRFRDQCEGKYIKYTSSKNKNGINMASYGSRVAVGLKGKDCTFAGEVSAFQVNIDSGGKEHYIQILAPTTKRHRLNQTFQPAAAIF